MYFFVYASRASFHYQTPRTTKCLVLTNIECDLLGIKLRIKIQFFLLFVDIFKNRKKVPRLGRFMIFFTLFWSLTCRCYAKVSYLLARNKNTYNALLVNSIKKILLLLLLLWFRTLIFFLSNTRKARCLNTVARFIVISL